MIDLDEVQKHIQQPSPVINALIAELRELRKLRASEARPADDEAVIVHRCALALHAHSGSPHHARPWDFLEVAEQRWYEEMARAAVNALRGS